MKRFLFILATCLVVASFCYSANRTISKKELLDKIEGCWVGQIVGNFMGFPFENVYVEEPVPIFVDRYYTFRDATRYLRLNDKDMRSYSLLVMKWMEGAIGDDDTDIEFVTLHAVEKYGLDITYPEITQMWKKHINRKIWVANRTARTLMDKGMIPPETGSKENNENWFQIDPQLVNEIWSVFYPGMTKNAAKRAEWSARITNDDWGTHPTIAYAVMYSAAFFKKDTDTLVQYALEALPEDSPFTEGVKDVISWHKENKDWRKTRELIHQKYYRYKKGDYEAPVSVVSSLCNGLCGIMAILYGDGDFVKTVGIAVSGGYDCDNQASTCGGLIGVIHGGSKIPDRFTRHLGEGIRWNKPFNDQYINYTRDDLPICNKISDIVARTAEIAEDAILASRGRKLQHDGEIVYKVMCDF